MRKAARGWWWTGIVATVAVAAGCGPSDSASSDETASTTAPAVSTPAPTDPWSSEREVPVVRKSRSGGLSPYFGPPDVSIYEDGTVIAAAEEVGGIAPFTLSQLSPAGLDAVLSAAEDAGLTGPDLLDDPPTPDAAMTTIVVRRDGESYTTTIGLGRGARAEAVREFLLALHDLEGLAGAGNMETVATMEAPRIEVTANKYAGPNRASVLAKAIPWKGLPLDSLECAELDGDDADAVRAAVRAAPAATWWIDDGTAYRVRVLPLLPDESACD